MKTVNPRTVPLSEIVDLPVHPEADLWPILADSDRDRENGKEDAQTISIVELADSILEIGLVDPLVLFNGQLLDGRNRRKALIKAKVEEVSVVDFEGTEEEASEFVMAKNDRRDLTPSQRADVAAKYWDYEAEKASERSGMRTDLVENFPPGSEFGKTRDILARRFRVNPKYIDKIHKEREQTRQLRERAQNLQELADLEKLREEEARIALEEAKTTENREAMAAAAREANEATIKQVELREQSNQLSQKAADKQKDLDRISKGASVNKVYGETKKESTDDDPIGKIRSQVNQNVSNLKKIISELAILTDKGDEIYDFLGTRFQALCDHLQDEFSIEQEFDCYDSEEEEV